MKQTFVNDKTYIRIDFEETSLKRGEYENYNFNNCDFFNTDLSEIKFTECKFIGCNLNLVKIN